MNLITMFTITKTIYVFFVMLQEKDHKGTLNLRPIHMSSKLSTKRWWRGVGPDHCSKRQSFEISSGSNTA